MTKNKIHYKLLLKAFKMKYKKIDLIIEIILCCLPFLLFSGCFYLSLTQSVSDGYGVSAKHSDVVYDFEKLWNIPFPEEFTSNYIFYNRGGWFGEGFFYAVYEWDRPDTEFLKDFSRKFNEEVQSSIEGCFDSFDYRVENYDSPYEILLDRAFMPDFEEIFISVSYHKGIGDKIYIGKDNCDEYCDDHLYMCFFPKMWKLYIYEHIT